MTQNYSCKTFEDFYSRVFSRDVLFEEDFQLELLLQNETMANRAYGMTCLAKHVPDRCISKHSWVQINITYFVC